MRGLTRYMLCVGFLVLSQPIRAQNQGPTRPIEVKVEVTEVDNLKASNLGVRWLDSFSFSESKIAGPVELGQVARISPLQADLHMLVEEGAAELLANPNLVTDSGTVATFHAGGEIPYVTNTSLGATHVEFKPYGVMLEIQPMILENGLIQLSLKASISAPDQANGVMVSGTEVPGLFERELTSNVTLRSKNTVTLAGLLQTQKENKVQGVPFLKSIPILGNLFKWRRTSFRRTTIIMFVTPSEVTL